MQPELRNGVASEILSKNVALDKNKDGKKNKRSEKSRLAPRHTSWEALGLWCVLLWDVWCASASRDLKDGSHTDPAP